jgi:hypothetical protein
VQFAAPTQSSSAPSPTLPSTRDAPTQAGRTVSYAGRRPWSPRVTAPVLAAALLWAAGCQTPMFLVGGDSVFCGDRARLRLQVAQFTYDRFDEKAGEAIWAGSRRVTLKDPIPLTPEQIRDVVLVDRRGGGTQLTVAGASGTGAGGRTSSSSGGDAPDDWYVRVALTSEGAARLSEVLERIEGGFDIIALVVGDTVFTTAVAPPLTGGIASFDLASRRAKEDAIKLFREELGCAAAEAPAG